MSDNAIDFPRGGASIISPLEARKIRNAAEKDILFKSGEPEKKKKKQIKSSKPTEDAKPASKKKITTEQFSFKCLKKGVLILGYVRERNKSEYIIGLPNSLNGYIKISELQSQLNNFTTTSSDSEDTDNEGGQNKTIVNASNMFSIGQLLPVAVTEISKGFHGYKKVVLSCFPEDVIHPDMSATSLHEGLLVWGRVQSLEDYGYTVSFGTKKISGFLPKKNSQSDLQLGALSWFSVSKVNENRKIATLTSCYEKILKAKACSKDAQFTSFLPGQLVKFTSNHESDVGSGTIFSSFDAFVDKFHMPLDMEDRRLKKVPGRILHVNLATKQIGVSLLPELLPFPENMIDKSHKTGNVIEQCEVLRCDSHTGLLVEITSETRGYVHISRVSDSHLEKLDKRYKVGTKQRCRILGYSALDSVYVLTMRKSDIEKQFLSYEDIKPGMVVLGVIVTLEDFGCLIKINEHIRGLCPRIHLADIALKHPEKKFVEGKNLKFRAKIAKINPARFNPALINMLKVLSCKPDNRKLVLTHKKTLLNSDLPLISDYTDAKIHEQYHGFVKSVHPTHLLVSFYGNVVGLVPKSFMSLAREASVELSFYVGQVLKCTVVSVTLGDRKLTLSLKDPEAILGDNAQVKVGEVLKGVCSEYSNDVVHVKTSANRTVLLPLLHTSDFANLSNQWYTLLSSAPKDLQFNGLVVWGRDKKQNLHNVTAKKCLLETNAAIKSFNDLKVDMLLGGFISHIMPYGVFVQVADGINGLVPNANLRDDYVNDPTEAYYLQQSLLVKVVKIDEEKKRFLLTAKPSLLLNDTPSGLSSNLYETYALQRNILTQACQHSPNIELRALSTLHGEIIIAKVNVVNHREVTVIYYDTNNDVTLYGYITQSTGSSLETGDDCQCYVVDVDISTKSFNAFVHQPAIIHALQEEKKNIQFEKNKKMNALVVYSSNELTAVVLTEYGHKLAYATPRQHLNDTKRYSKKIFVNSEIAVAYVRQLNGEIVVRVLHGLQEDEMSMSVGSIINTIMVKAVKPTQLSVNMCNGRLHGRVHISNIKDTIDEGVPILNDFKPLQTLKAKIIGFRDCRTHNYLPISHTNISKSIIELSLKQSVLASDDVPAVDRRPEDFQVGEKVFAFITSITMKIVWLTVNPSVKAKMSILNLSDDIKILKKWHSHFKAGYAYTCTVQAVNKDKLELTRTEIAADVGQGCIVNGRVLKIIKNVGLLIELPNQSAGIAHLTELSDRYVENPLQSFKVDKFLKCKVLACKKTGNYDLSVRSSRLSDDTSCEDTDDRAIDGYDDIKEGDILRGYIKSCSSVGVFVSLSPMITGRVQIKNLSQYFVKDFSAIFTVGKLVKAKVINIDPSNNHINLSLRGKDVKDKDLAPPPPKRKHDNDGVVDCNNDGELIQKKRKTLESEDEEVTIRKIEDSDDTSEEEDADDEDNDEGTSLETLKLRSSFDWNDEEMESTKRSDGSSDEEKNEDDIKSHSKKSKRQKRAAKKAEEEFLYKAESALLDSKRPAENTEDFDRLVLASPNSSIVWIQYMAFHLNAAEVEKARQVSRKALQTISFREEQERLNVWVALLNMECIYGSAEGLEKTLHEAAQANDSKTVYLKMLEIYTKNNKINEAEQLYQTVLKKFKNSKRVWIGYGYFLMKCGKQELARGLLQRSLKSLPERNHVETIVQFSLMEYKMGDAQRGSTILESVLKNYPRRVDLWSVYIDMSIKQGDFEQVRNIFERVTTLTLGAKKMKFLFKRYLQFEEKHGSENSVEKVRRKAEEYVAEME